MEIAYQANASIPKHSHGRAHFRIPLQGHCTEVYHGGSEEYKPFTLGFLPPDRWHSLNHQGAKPSWFCIKIDTERLEKLSEYSKVPHDVVHFRGGLLNELVFRLYREFSRPDSLSRLAIEGLCFEMLAEVSRRAPPLDRKPARWLVQAREFLDENYVNQMRLGAIAEGVGIHPVHLAREFRRHFSYSVGEYVRTRRIEYACRQLTMSDTPLADIAIAAGFSDQSHLSRMFKRVLGTTPAEYRKVSGRITFADEL